MYLGTLWLLWCKFWTGGTVCIATWMHAAVTFGKKEHFLRPNTTYTASHFHFFYSICPNQTNVYYVAFEYTRALRNLTTSVSYFLFFLLYSVFFYFSLYYKGPSFYSALKVPWKSVASSPVFMTTPSSWIVATTSLLTSDTTFHCLVIKVNLGQFIFPLLLIIIFAEA